MTEDRSFLKDYTLAEDVILCEAEHGCDVTFSWLCPHCGRRHWATEEGIAPTLGNLVCLTMTGKPFANSCEADIRVRFPWSEETPRDPESVYGYQKYPEGGRYLVQLAGKRLEVRR